MQSRTAYFDSHPKVEKFYFTADRQAWFRREEAVSFAQMLPDKTVEEMTREQAVEADAADEAAKGIVELKPSGLASTDDSSTTLVQADIKDETQVVEADTPGSEQTVTAQADEKETPDPAVTDAAPAEVKTEEQMQVVQATSENKTGRNKNK